MKNFCILAITLSLFPWTRGDDLVVTVEQGKLRGSKLFSRNGTEYRSFLAIPYAKPPLGELRFQVNFLADDSFPKRNRFLSEIFPRKMSFFPKIAIYK